MGGAECDEPGDIDHDGHDHCRSDDYYSSGWPDYYYGYNHNGDDHADYYYGDDHADYYGHHYGHHYGHDDYGHYGSADYYAGTDHDHD